MPCFRLTIAAQAAGYWKRRDLFAVGAFPADLDHRSHRREACRLGGGSDAAGDAVVIDMSRLPARIADEEDTVVQAIRVGIGDIGVRALDPAREIGADEEIEDPVHAVRRDSATGCL